MIREQFLEQVPLWITRKPAAHEDGNQSLYSLEGHRSSVNAMAFSLDGQLLASASSDETIRV
jgi:WD40 repeat protein